MPKDVFKNLNIPYPALQFDLYQDGFDINIRDTNLRIQEIKAYHQTDSFDKMVQQLTNLQYVKQMLEYQKYDYHLNQTIIQQWQTKKNWSAFKLNMQKIQNQFKFKHPKLTTNFVIYPNKKIDDLINALRCTNYQNQKIKMRIANQTNRLKINAIQTLNQKELQTWLNYYQNHHAEQNHNKIDLFKWYLTQNQNQMAYFKALNHWFQNLYHAKNNPSVNPSPFNIRETYNHQYLTIIKNSEDIPSIQEQLQKIADPFGTGMQNDNLFNHSHSIDHIIKNAFDTSNITQMGSLIGHMIQVNRK